MLLDEGFPSPGFDPAALDPGLEVTPLREFDLVLVNDRTPDWYLYLRADEANYNALVTRDWHQSGQAEEMWALTKTKLSIVTWQKPIDDPVVEWGQMMAYLPEIRRMISAQGPSVVFLPRPRLTKERLVKAVDALALLAREEGRSRREVVRGAGEAVEAWLEEQGQVGRFDDLLS